MLSTHLVNSSELVQHFISTIAARSTVVDPVRPQHTNVCLSARSNSSGALTVRHKPTTVELSHFNGQKVDVWLFQVEHYFKFYSILHVHQLPLASIHLEGEALDWYRWMFRNKQLFDWMNFSKKLHLRFQDRSLCSPEGRLSKLVQTSIVVEFRARFEAISNDTIDLPDEFLFRFFYFGPPIGYSG